jgi:hypothetical protein
MWVACSAYGETISHTFDNGDKYVGEVKNGTMHGQGTYTWADDNKYVGDWKDGKKHGQGTFTFSNRTKMVGEWRDGAMWAGIGYLANQSISGTFTDGEWCEGCKPKSSSVASSATSSSGKVTLYRLTPHKKFVQGGRKWFRNGDDTIHAKYVGEVKNGRPHGSGEIFLKGRKIYSGHYKDGKWHGQGTSYYDDGRIKYVGEYFDDKKHGQGTVTYSDGDEYVYPVSASWTV